MSILRLNESQFDTSDLHALNQREWRYRSNPFERSELETRKPLKIEFRQLAYMLPVLWISGVCAGVGIMLALQ